MSLKKYINEKKLSKPFYNPSLFFCYYYYLSSIPHIANIMIKQIIKYPHTGQVISLSAEKCLLLWATQRQQSHASGGKNNVNNRAVKMTVAGVLVVFEFW